MTKLVLSDVTSGYASTTVVNANNALVEAAVEKSLFRDGTGPNQMEADFDMNGFNILNQGNPITMNGFNWEGPWITGTAYQVGDVVENNGTSYIAIVAHTSAVAFATDSANWQTVAEANLPTQSGFPNRFLQTSGVVASWEIPDAAEVSFTQTGASASVTLDARLKQTLSVKDFAATGDGTTPDGNAFWAADAAASPGDLVIIPPGTYRFSASVLLTRAVYWFMPGAVIKLDAGMHVDFQTRIIADAGGQIFDVSAVGSGAYGTFGNTTYGYVDFVTADWWGAKGNGVVDCTTAFQAAIDVASTVSSVRKGCPVRVLSGTYYIAGSLNITKRISVIGEGRTSTLSFTHANSELNVYGTEATKVENNVFSNLEFVGISTPALGATPASASVINLNWLKYTKFENCFFYHININTDHMAWWSIDHCEFFDLEFTNNFTQLLGEANDISGGPKIDNSFFSVAQVTCTDTVDFQATNTHWFGGDFAVKFRYQYWTPGGGEVIGIPFFITNCTFDSIQGHALDIYDAYGAMISNCWFSAGRGYGVDGVSLYRSSRVTVSGCSFIYCGNTNLTSGLTIDTCDYVSVIGGTFSNNYTYGIKLSASDYVSIIGATFANNPHVYGGYYTQTNGVSDPAGNSTYVTVMGCRFDPTLTIKLYAPASTNTYVSNTGFDVSFIGAATRTTVYTVAALPTAVSDGSGSRRMVSDATVNTFGTVVAGGGAITVPIFSDGADWRIG